jgi:hypothetical protein
MHIRLFTIWYSTTFTLLTLLLLLLTATTPADHIYQSVRSTNIRSIFVVGGVYVLTALICLFLYASRLYTNRAALQAIPKGYIPIEEDEVGRSVRRLIVKQLRRSALIAWDARPRDEKSEPGAGGAIAEERPGTTEGKEYRKEKEKGRRLVGRRKAYHEDTATVIPVSFDDPPWGVIAHPGWSSPASTEYPSVKYETVISELPRLIEAAAVRLAPPDRANEELGNADEGYFYPDMHIFRLLKRPTNMDLRSYFNNLITLGLVQPSTGSDFLDRYEYARFSGVPLTEQEFQTLMSIYADILNNMAELDPDRLASLAEEMSSQDSSSVAPSKSSAIRYSIAQYATPGDGHSSDTGSFTSASPVTARTGPSDIRKSSFSRTRSPVAPDSPSTASLNSVIIHPTHHSVPAQPQSSSSSIQSNQSVIRHTPHMSSGR